MAADAMHVVSDSDNDHWYEEEDEDDENSAPDSVLLSLVQSYDWPGTLARIASHPDGTLVSAYCFDLVLPLVLLRSRGLSFSVHY